MASAVNVPMLYKITSFKTRYTVKKFIELCKAALRAILPAKVLIQSFFMLALTFFACPNLVETFLV